MPVAPPSVPTPLLDVGLSDRPRRNVGTVVLVRPGGSDADSGTDGTGEAEVVLGPGAERVPDGFPDTAGATGKSGELLNVPGVVPCWLLGVGAADNADWRSAGAVLARALHARAESDSKAGRRITRSAQLQLPAETTAEQVAALTLGAALGGYHFTVSAVPPGERATALHLVHPDAATLGPAVTRAHALARATGLARDLANMPSNVKNPDWLARTAQRVCAGTAGLQAVVHDERWLAEQGFGGVLAVGGGSASPPRLIELSWRPPRAAKAAGTPHLVFVGKGITFDTGGISIKPNAGMHLMRTDMAGGGAVLAAMVAIAELGVPLRVSALIPAAENHVSGSSYRPGDIVRHYGGQTTEVTNTDAEGRMVMADALVYARRKLGADVLVDAATLTGAMKIALGLRIGGVFASTDELAGLVDAAGRGTGEAWWRMPLSDAHAEDVVSETADVRQIPPGPSAIGAALFLREFVGDVPWAHLDIAGPARAEKTYDEVVPGASGFAARTLVELATALSLGAPVGPPDE